MDRSYTYYSRSSLETEELGLSLGRIIKGGEIILLVGELGSGKTVLVKGIAKGLDIKENIVSPTFIIIKNYDMGRLRLNHIDLYRISSLDGLGIEEYLDDHEAVTVIEWGEKIKDYIEEYLLIKFEILDDNSRKIIFTPMGDRYRKFIEGIRDVYLST
ncbi:MAG: tRNA (adenosine(37)-N6)-threonylcarbamoyltransferase complex ATPase subunit type 1 TsaE [bacterium]